MSRPSIKIRLLGSSLWVIGFVMVMGGCLVRGPALGIGSTIDQPRWENEQLKYEFAGTTYHVTLPKQTPAPPVIHLIPHYTRPLADWDSILLLGQDLKVESATGQILYQTDTTHLRLAQPALGDYSVGQVADGLVRIGTAASLIGPLVVMIGGRWLVPALWIAAVSAYLVI